MLCKLDVWRSRLAPTWGPGHPHAVPFVACRQGRVRGSFPPAVPVSLLIPHLPGQGSATPAQLCWWHWGAAAGTGAAPGYDARASGCDSRSPGVMPEPLVPRHLPGRSCCGSQELPQVVTESYLILHLSSPTGFHHHLPCRQPGHFQGSLLLIPSLMPLSSLGPGQLHHQDLSLAPLLLLPSLICSWGLHLTQLPPEVPALLLLSPL